MTVYLAVFCFRSDLQVPFVIMHTRGTPDTMNSMAEYKNDITDEVCAELDDQIQKATEVGVPRWNQIIDPGIGFAKKGEQNLELLGNLSRFREHFHGRYGCVLVNWAVSASRKAHTSSLFLPHFLS